MSKGGWTEENWIMTPFGTLSGSNNMDYWARNIIYAIASLVSLFRFSKEMYLYLECVTFVFSVNPTLIMQKEYCMCFAEKKVM